MQENLDDFIINNEDSVQKPQGFIKGRNVKKTNTSEQDEAHKALELDMAQKQLVDVYKNEEKYPVRVAPAYAKYFGRVMHVSINGISVGIRCDGKTVELPESFATEVLRRMDAMDSYERSMDKMSAVEKNFESSPGQLNFFG